MVEREVTVDEEYEADVDIDFKLYTEQEKMAIMLALLGNRTYTFKNISLNFNGEVIVEIEPQERY